MLDNVLKDGQLIHCQTQEEIDNFIDVAEAKGLRWVGNAEMRDFHDTPPIVYEIRHRKVAVEVDFTPDNAIPASELRNYAISIRAKRS